MERHFDRWDYQAVQELERLCSSLPVLPRERASAFFTVARKATGSEGNPVERQAGKVFESLMGVVSASERKDFTATSELDTESVARGVLMIETYDSVIGTLFCVARVSENSFLTRGWTERNKESVKRLRTTPAPSAVSRDTRNMDEAEHGAASDDLLPHVAVAAPTLPARGPLQNLIDVLLSPREAFTTLVARPGFWLPLLLQVALAVAFTAVWIQKVDMAEFLKNQWVESGQWDKIPAEQRAGVLETQSKMIPIFAWVSALVVGPVAVLVMASALMFVFRFFYAGEVTFKQSMTLVVYSMLAYALVTTPLLLLVLSLKGDWNLNPQDVLQANPTLFLDRDAVAKPVWALVGSLDLFVFWAIWLLATGFGVAVKRDTRSALWGVVVPWALFVVIKVGFAALS